MSGAFRRGRDRLRSGDAAAAGLDPERLDRVDRLLAGGVGSVYPGAVALVARGGTVALHRAYGEAALAPERRPMSPDTVFDVASLTKVAATATAVMILVEEGRFRLDDPVGGCCPLSRPAAARGGTG